MADYTLRQCEAWDIPVKGGVPLEHVFDLHQFEWHDQYVDLPVNPRNEAPLLLVPRRMVRVLPWINFDDYKNSEYRMFLRASVKPGGRQTDEGMRERSGHMRKEHVVGVTRRDLSALDDYVRRKESEASRAGPELDRLGEDIIHPKADELMTKLKSIEPGRAGAIDYQRELLGILNHLFEPELTDGKLEERTIDGTERRDIIFTNEADSSFWQYIRQQYGGFLVMFEAKNVQKLDNEHINQVATYLGDRLGRFAIVVTRNVPSQAQIRKTYSVYNDSSPRKVILILHDGELEAILRLKDRGESPTKYVQQLYRRFKVALQ